MKIEDNRRQSNTEVVGNLQDGTPFRFCGGDKVFIKCNPDLSPGARPGSRFVNPYNGEIYSIDSQGLVIPADNVKLVIDD